MLNNEKLSFTVLLSEEFYKLINIEYSIFEMMGVEIAII